jgi:drug/metabolite transporter (DMT)-like permease
VKVKMMPTTMRGTRASVAVTVTTARRGAVVRVTRRPGTAREGGRGGATATRAVGVGVGVGGERRRRRGRGGEEEANANAMGAMTTDARGRGREVRARAVLGGEEGDAATTASAGVGRLLLIFVAMAYGTLTVTLKLVFESQGAPTAGVLGGVRGLMTVLCFAPMLAGKNSTGGPGDKTGPAFWRSAAELAFWNIGNQGLCNVALLFTDATRVSFFTQASIAFTPFIASLGGDRVSTMTWLGCALAFVGVAVLGMDGGAAAAELGGSFNLGDWLALAGAASYSMYIYRIGMFAKQGFSGQGLQIWKNAFLGLMYGAWALSDVYAYSSGAIGASIPWAGWQNWKIWALIAFSAIIPGCVADLTQAKGQETVSASESSVILAGEPLFAALFGAIFLGEFLGPMGYLGGGLIVAGGLVAAEIFKPKSTSK